MSFRVGISKCGVDCLTKQKLRKVNAHPRLIKWQISHSTTRRSSVGTVRHYGRNDQTAPNCAIALSLLWARLNWGGTRASRGALRAAVPCRSRQGGVPGAVQGTTAAVLAVLCTNNNAGTATLDDSAIAYNTAQSGEDGYCGGGIFDFSGTVPL